VGSHHCNIILYFNRIFSSNSFDLFIYKCDFKLSLIYRKHYFQGAGHNDVELHPHYYERLRKFLSVELVKWQLKNNVDGGVSDTTSGVVSNSNPAAGSASLSSKHPNPNPAPAAGSEASKKNVETNNKRNENDGL